MLFHLSRVIVIMHGTTYPADHMCLLLNSISVEGTPQPSLPDFPYQIDMSVRELRGFTCSTGAKIPSATELLGKHISNMMTVCCTEVNFSMF